MMTEAGRHYDDEKPLVGEISPEAIEAEGMVLLYGQKKYGLANWRRGIHFTRLYASALRHLLAWRRGEDIDLESGLPHLAHARVNIGFLLHYILTGMGPVWDDRAGPPIAGQIKAGPTIEQGRWAFGPPQPFVIDKGQLPR